MLPFVLLATALAVEPDVSAVEGSPVLLMQCSDGSFFDLPMVAKQMPKEQLAPLAIMGVDLDQGLSIVITDVEEQPNFAMTFALSTPAMMEMMGAEEAAKNNMSYDNDSLTIAQMAPPMSDNMVAPSAPLVLPNTDWPCDAALSTSVFGDVDDMPLPPDTMMSMSFGGGPGALLSFSTQPGQPLLGAFEPRPIPNRMVPVLGEGHISFAFPYRIEQVGKLFAPLTGDGDASFDRIDTGDIQLADDVIATVALGDGAESFAITMPVVKPRSPKAIMKKVKSAFGGGTVTSDGFLRIEEDLFVATAKGELIVASSPMLLNKLKKARRVSPPKGLVGLGWGVMQMTIPDVGPIQNSMLLQRTDTAMQMKLSPLK